jgi:COMPASS component SWD3
LKFKSLLPFPLISQYNAEIAECFTCRFEKGDGLIAGGYSNGYICIFSVETNECLKYMKASEYPVTCIRWKPHNEFKPKNILVTVAADGKITHFHTATGKALHTMEEKDNPIMCLDYNNSGSIFATGGSDKQVRLYDDNTKTLLGVMKQSNFSHPGHSNRVFAVNFHKDNPNLLVSGGWDNTIQFYDVRMRSIVNSLYGPHICGDSIDMDGDYLLTGSWSVEDQLQLWDMRTMKLFKNLQWDKDNTFNSTYIYSAQFSKQQSSNGNKLFAIGGSNNNIFRVFENNTEDRLPQITSKYMSSSCYTVDFSNNGNLFAYGCGDGGIRILNVGKRVD